MARGLDALARSELLEIDPGEVLFDEPMSARTGIGIGGPADAFVRVRDVESLRGLLAWCRRSRARALVMGEGAGLLVADAGIGVVIALGEAFGVIESSPAGGDAPEGDAGGKVSAPGEARVRAGAGARLADVLAFGRERGLSGLEALAGLPGTVGGALAMGAGGRGGGLPTAVASVTWLTTRGRLEEVPREALDFGAGGLAVPEGHVIVAAELLLRPSSPERVGAAMEAAAARRAGSEPKGVRAAGGVFRDPAMGEPAGEVIERLGLRGIRIRGARISEVHGNWVVNEGGATARDVLLLMDYVRDRARREAGVELVDALRVVGRVRR
ncbi:FAD-binding protein [Myxococcota bacterium]|nr:FAD-binding protein [Myxococcota bacterium]